MDAGLGARSVKEALDLAEDTTEDVANLGDGREFDRELRELGDGEISREGQVDGQVSGDDAAEVRKARLEDVTQVRETRLEDITEVRQTGGKTGEVAENVTKVDAREVVKVNVLKDLLDLFEAKRAQIEVPKVWRLGQCDIIECWQKRMYRTCPRAPRQCSHHTPQGSW